MTTIAFRRFSNALRIMRSLDEHEVPDLASWAGFRDNPFLYFLRASGKDQATIWRAINNRQPEDLRLGPPHVLIIAVCFMLAASPPPARGDALWDWYFGPGAARCDQIKTLPEMAIAIGNKLEIANAKPKEMLAWFAMHPQYQDAIERERTLLERTCRR